MRIKQHSPGECRSFDCVSRRKSPEFVCFRVRARACSRFLHLVWTGERGLASGDDLVLMSNAKCGLIQAWDVFCLRVPEAVFRASPGNAPSPRPPDQCRRRRRTYCAGVSDTDIGRGGGLCSTEQAPRSLNLCCHSLPSDGVDRPFRARTLTPLLRPIVSDISRSGKGARADMCRGRGWNGAVCTDLCTSYYVPHRLSLRGAPRNTFWGPGSGCPV